MMQITYKLLILLTLSLTPANAADFQKGFAAYESGDYATALLEWKPLAEQGNADAQHNLGEIYSKSKGDAQDYPEALKWYRLAAKQGHANAMYMVGKAYDVNYWGVQQDFGEAAKWFLLAAEQGHAHAQQKIASMYSFGQGLPNNQDESMKWYKLAAAQGSASEQTSMAYFFHYGLGNREPDLAEAAKWYRMAANQGDASAQKELGAMYNKGEGVIQDNLLAYMWSSLATENGNKSAVHNRDIIVAKMGSDEITKAQQMADVCKASNYENCGT
jgi:hypothetical protein